VEGPPHALVTAAAALSGVELVASSAD